MKVSAYRRRRCGKRLLRVAAACCAVCSVILLCAGCSRRTFRYEIRCSGSGNQTAYSVLAVEKGMKYRSGVLQKAELRSGTLIAAGDDVFKVGGVSIFRADGSPVSVTLAGRVPLRIRKESGIRISFKGETLFDPDGFVRAGQLSEKAALSYGTGHSRLYLPADTRVWLDGRGMLYSFAISTGPGPRFPELKDRGISPGIRYVILDDGTAVSASDPRSIGRL